MLGVSLTFAPKAKNIKYEEPITPSDQILSDYSSDVIDVLNDDILLEPIGEANLITDEVPAQEEKPDCNQDLNAFQSDLAQEPIEPIDVIEPEPVPEPEPIPEPELESELNTTFYYDVPLSHKIQDYLFKACETYGVPVPLALAIIEIESDFNPNVVSSTRDYGLFQVNRCNFSSCRAHMNDNSIDFLDPITNIECGVWLFSVEYHAESENATLALMRYNNGPTGARRKWAKGIYETSYTRKVLKAYNKYIAMGE